MSNKKISQLLDLPAVTSDDLTVVVDLATMSTRKASLGNIRSFVIDDVQSRVDSLEAESLPASEIIKLSPLQIAQKKVLLTMIPDLSYSITILPRGGCLQFQYDDFVVEDEYIISWAGLGLDGLLEAGDTIKVDYHTQR
jgi:hypothetical protein